MTFYLYRITGTTKEYLAGRSMCLTYVTTERGKAKSFNFRFDAEQKVKDYSTSIIKWYIEEAN